MTTDNSLNFNVNLTSFQGPLDTLLDLAKSQKVNLENNISSYPHHLSGGQQQRVSIARALVKNPLVILADEPTGNLDPNISDGIIDLLEIATENGASVLMSTHNFPLIKPRKKRFIELSNGRIID